MTYDELYEEAIKNINQYSIAQCNKMGAFRLRKNGYKPKKSTLERVIEYKKKHKPDKLKLGRPLLYSDEFIKKIIQKRKDGKSYAELEKTTGIKQQVLRAVIANRLKKY
jgi:hypothetical protein